MHFLGNFTVVCKFAFVILCFLMNLVFFLSWNIVIFCNNRVRVATLHLVDEILRIWDESHLLEVLQNCLKPLKLGFWHIQIQCRKVWKCALMFVNFCGLTLLEPRGFGDFRKKTAVFGGLSNALAPPPIALESCSVAQTDRPV